MELTGLQIFKYLPGAKKEACANCKKCGFPTCMAFALKLAKKQAELEKCPHIPQELKEKFSESLKIQQHEIYLADNLKTGGETVLFRHDKTFVNKTVIAIKLQADDKDFDKKLKKISEYETERIGEKFKVDAIYLSGDETSTIFKLNEQKIKNAGLAIIKDNTENYNKANSCPNL